VFAIWANRGFGGLSEESLAVLGATLLIVGIQVFFSSFLLSILGLRRSPSALTEAAQSESRKLESIE
jgi:hypothetical protein